MIIDQGCQTNAPRAKVFVSSEKEIWWNDNSVSPSDELLMPPDFQSFLKKVDRCQGIAGFSRFRVYGEIDRNCEHTIVLVTEFREFKDNAEFWRQLENVRDNTAANVWIMEDGIDRERLYHHDYNGMREEDGPNHGRAYMQVELSWRIERMNYRQIEQLIGRLAQATEALWNEAGVDGC